MERSRLPDPIEFRNVSGRRKVNYKRANLVAARCMDTTSVDVWLLDTGKEYIYLFFLHDIQNIIHMLLERGNTKGRDGLSPVFQERSPWSIMDETNKAKEHKKAQERNTVAIRLRHPALQRLRCVDARLCKGV